MQRISRSQENGQHQVHRMNVTRRFLFVEVYKALVSHLSYEPDIRPTRGFINPIFNNYSLSVLSHTLEK